MKTKRKPIKRRTPSLNDTNSENTPILKNLLTGLIFACMITAIGLILLALLMTYTNLFKAGNQYAIVIIAITVLSLIIGGSRATKNMGSSGWLWGFVLGLMYVVIRFIISYFVNNNVSMVGNIVSDFIMCLASGTLGGFLGGRRRR